MTRTILITGGARSGKSEYAESLLPSFARVVYVATARIPDDGMRDRVQIHRERRPETWKTFEATYDLFLAATPETPYYLLDCVGNLTSNIMEDLTLGLERIPLTLQKQVEDRAVAELQALRDRIAALDGTLVIVTNEVGLSIVPEHHVARVYRDILGKVNQRVAAFCDEVYLVVCGIPMKIK